MNRKEPVETGGSVAREIEWSRRGEERKLWRRRIVASPEMQSFDRFWQIQLQIGACESDLLKLRTFVVGGKKPLFQQRNSVFLKPSFSFKRSQWKLTHASKSVLWSEQEAESLLIFMIQRETRTRMVEYGGIRAKRNTTLEYIYCYKNHSESLLSLNNIESCL